MIPYCTIFHIQSLDGKISTGIGDRRDFDSDLANDAVLSGGFQDYHEFEKDTDYWSLITDTTAGKLGANDGEFLKSFHKHGFILWYNGNIDISGIKHIYDMCENLIVVTAPGNMRTVRTASPNIALCALTGRSVVDIQRAMHTLHDTLGVDKITIQSGGTLNAQFIRARVINKVVVYVAPVLIGGAGTTSLVDGANIVSDNDLKDIKSLNLKEATIISKDFLRLVYEVNNDYLLWRA